MCDRTRALAFPSGLGHIASRQAYGPGVHPNTGVPALAKAGRALPWAPASCLASSSAAFNRVAFASALPVASPSAAEAFATGGPPAAAALEAFAAG